MSKNNKDFFKKKKEWSVVKDTLLACYLPQYFQKLLKTERPIYYVDCFAGKGKYDDGEEGSPLIAMKIRNERLELSTAVQAKRPGAIQFCFIELNHAADLQRHVDAFPCSFDKPEIISGRFEDHIRDKLRDKQGKNVFLYIDPYGIQALDSNLFLELQTYGFNSFEMLINFNSFGFFRDACRVMKVDYTKDEAFLGLEDLVEYEPAEFDYSTSTGIEKSEKLLSSIAGGDYWKDIVRGFHNGDYDGYSAERRLSTAYREELKKRHAYVLDMPIRMKQDSRPKYRMIHVSDHEAACFLMAENMQNRKSELFINVQQHGQMSIFDITPEYTSSVEGEVHTIDEIEEKIKKHIQSCPHEIRYMLFVAKFCNQYGLICDFDMIQDVLIKLETQGAIEIVREPAMTPTGTKKSSFWTDNDSKDKKVTIRRKSL